MLSDAYLKVNKNKLKLLAESTLNHADSELTSNQTAKNLYYSINLN